MSDIIRIIYRNNLNPTNIKDIQKYSIFIITCSYFFSFLYYNLVPLFDKDKHIKPSTLLSQLTDSNIIYYKENITIDTTNTIDSISKHNNDICISKHNNNDCISVLRNKRIRVSRHGHINILKNKSTRVSRHSRIRNDIGKTISVLDLFTFFFISQSYISKIYHISIFIIIFYNYYNIPIEYKFVFLYQFLKTEVSCVFYILKYLFPKKTIIYQVNTFFYYIAFIKFRIYDFYYEIIYNNIYFDIIFKKHTEPSYFIYILLISFYILYTLNLYWFLIMNKILYKTITKIININTDILCHNICRFLYLFNIPLCSYIYTYNINQKYVFDIIGIIILSITSYIYHNDIYKMLYNKKIEKYKTPNKENIYYFLNDFLSINMRCYLAIVSIYYTKKHFFFILSVSGILHLFFIYLSIINIIQLIIDYDKIKKETFFFIHTTLLSIPILCDMFLVYIISSNEIAIPFLFLNIIIGLLYLVEPFYKLTHVVFHILLIYQTYYICLSNSI
jgi:hypothetical protein